MMTDKSLIELAHSLISDPDEEIFLLYSALNNATSTPVGPDGHRGLGHIDSRKNTLSCRFELRPTIAPGTANYTKRTTRLHENTDAATRIVEVEIAQDPTALRSRNGDTGSVVWRASTELARALLQEHFFPPEAPVFNRNRFVASHCLELGAGTGLLGVVLAPLVRAYTITDALPLLSLIRKNIALNTPDRSPIGILPHVNVEELDWLTLASLPPGTMRTRYCPVPRVAKGTGPESETSDDRAWDLVLAVDCIYNPSLLPALVETLDAVSTVGRTWVLIVAELRQEDVLREFLELWLNHSGGKWEIRRIDGLLDVHFVVWAGRKC